MNQLQCGRFRLDLEKPLVMGIVNLTPDSFSNDGLGRDVERAIAHARQQLDAGADILDLGAESSRPGAMPTPVDEELARLLPVINEVVRWGVPVSVDTYKPLVMHESLSAGASMINDIQALCVPGALEAVRDSSCGLCLMHMQGVPGTMQHSPVYGDVVREVMDFLQERVHTCCQHGIDSERIVLDPGFGFGKSVLHNLALFKELTAFSALACPVLVGVSRKSMLGAVTGRRVEERMPASIAAALLAAQKGAKILRVHDVAATRDALAILAAIEEGEVND